MAAAAPIHMSSRVSLNLNIPTSKRPRPIALPDSIGSAGARWRYLKWRCLMDLTSLVVDGVILLVILAILISVVRAWRHRPARAQLIALPPETRTRLVLGRDPTE